MTQGEDPSETSPLLPEDDNRPGALIQSAEAPLGPPDGSFQGNGHANGKPRDDDEEQQQPPAATEADDDGREVQYRGDEAAKKELKYIIPAIAVGIWLSAADQTLIVSSYGKIGSDLNGLNKTSWIATAYFLTLTSIQPLYGKLSDIFGRKPTLLFAYTVFGLGCLFCGIARDMNELIAARAFSGIGAGGMTTVVSIIMSDIVPLRSRGVYQGVINIIFASGAGIGAPLGGVLADTIGWRWAFIGQAPMCAIAFVSCYFVLSLPKAENAHWRTKLRRIDFLGAFTLVAAVTNLLVGLDRGSNESWSATITIVTLCVSLLLFALFLLIELRYAKEPLAPGRVIVERSLFGAYLCNFFSFGGWFPILFYTPLWFQSFGLTATQSGLRLVPGIICGVTGSLLGGWVMKKTGRYYWLNVGAYTILAIASVPVLLFSGLVTNSTVGIMIGLALGGLGNGCGVTTSLIALISNAAPEDQAIATACSYLFRSLGSVVGLAVCSTVLQQGLRTHLQDRLRNGKDAEEITRRVRESLDYVNQLDPELAELVRDTYRLAIRPVFVMVIGITACAMISSFFVREKRLSR